MAGPGGGPSRRSHTKSRKGCKTCKRRHIRCDETFPQCRNCTKHQVRCDYMDNSTQGDSHTSEFETPNLLWTPDISRVIEAWQSTGQFPFPELQIFPQPEWHRYSKTDLRLIYHASSVCSEMLQNRTSKLAIWTDDMPKFISIAASHPFVMNAVLSFAANHLAWIYQSQETRAIAYQHAASAMKGLHEAIGTFSKSSADAVIATSLLLSWQSTEWKAWASLMTGIKTILGAMQGWSELSSLHDLMNQQGILFHHSFANGPTVFSPEERRDHMNILHTIGAALAKLRPYLATFDQEMRWVDQLAAYIERLRTSDPPARPDEQFSQLYALRKWLFWMPVTLLSSKKGDLSTLLVLSHFYATALAIEPLFPSIGRPFIANLALPSLEELVRIMNTVQTSDSFNVSPASAVMMQFPRSILETYQSRGSWAQSQSPRTYAIESLNTDLSHHIEQSGYNQSLSPAFSPAALHNTPVPPLLPGSLPHPPYLEIPRASGGIIGYAGSASSYSSPMTSPGMIPSFFKQEDDGQSDFGFGMAYGAYRASGVGVTTQRANPVLPSQIHAIENSAMKGKEKRNVAGL